MKKKLAVLKEKFFTKHKKQSLSIVTTSPIYAQKHILKITHVFLKELKRRAQTRIMFIKSSARNFI